MHIICVQVTSGFLTQQPQYQPKMKEEQDQKFTELKQLSFLSIVVFVISCSRHTVPT